VTTTQSQTKNLLALSSRSVGLYVGVIAALVMLATFALVGWLTLQTARAVQAELEAQATKKSILISRSLERAILNLKNTATALSHSHELQVDDLRGFYDLAKPFARSLDIQIVLRDVELEQQVVNTLLPWGMSLPGGGIPVAKVAEEEAWRTGQAAHSDVFYGNAAGKHFVVAFVAVTSTTGRRYSLSVGVATNRFTGHLESAQLGPDNLVTVFDRRGTIVTRSQEHDQYTGRTFNRDRSYEGGKPEATGVVLGPNLSGVPYQWNYARSFQTGWVVSVGTPVAALGEPVNEALALLAIAAVVLIFLTGTGAKLASRYLARRIGRLGVDRPPTQEEFRVLFETAPYGVAVVDSVGTVVLTNARMDAKFGYAREELLGHQIGILVPERFRATLDKHDNHTIDFGRELCGLRKDGSEFPAAISLNPIDSGRARFLMVTVVDLSARRHEEELAATVRAQREDFQRRLVRAEEAERLRLAHELHDETGQSLAAVGLAVRDLESCISERDKGGLRRVQDQLTALGKSLHDVARQLRPTSLDDLGLEVALTNHAADWSEKFGIGVDLQNQCDLDGVPSELAVVIYRVVQEALTNVAKHATGASTVSIIVTHVDNQLRLTIEDNGRGFSEPEVTLSPEPGSGGLGLPGMRERLTLVGGELEIESSVGAGTTLHARIPIQLIKELA
jgi:PAS domain S-box-containing protein